MSKDAWNKTDKQVREAYPDLIWRGKPSLFAENAKFLFDWTDFDVVQQEQADYGYTMCHGDFHGQVS